MAECIEREDLLKWMKEEKPKFYTEHGYFHGMTVGFDYAIKFVEQMPAADVVEVVHSKWIKRNNERRCPICHFFYLTNGTTVYNLCPMCGAKMDGETNE